ncbi:MAG: peptide deformylase [bacterium]|nr:peptide deformylase [bacterium]
MSKILKIITVPNDILRRKAKVIDWKTVDKKELKKLAENMVATMRESHGIGLAAPQIGQSVRLVTIDQVDDPLVLVNPVIKKFSWSKEIGQEGCLSVPGVFGYVKRAVSITVEAWNVQGKKVIFKAKGLLARVIQHEADHLDGVLFIDKLTETKAQSKIKM